MELATEVKKALTYVGINEIWDIVKENDMKNNPDYAAYNFRSKKHEDEFRETGRVRSITPTIYNQNAVDYIINVIRTAKP